MKRSTALAAIACLALAVGAVSLSCNGSRTATPPSTAAPLALAVVTDDSLAGLVVLADDEGFFASHGLEVTIVPVNGSSEALRLLLEREVDAATAADTPIALAALGGHEVRVLASIGSAVNDTRVVARRSTGIASPADLRGRTIGAVREATSHYFLHALLETEGVEKSEVNLMFASAEELPSLLAEGRVDAVSVGARTLDEALEAAGSDAVVLRAPEAFARNLALVSVPDRVSVRHAEFEALLRALIESESRAFEDAAGPPRGGGDAIPPTTVRVTLGQATLVSLEDQARWIVGSSCFPDVPPDTRMPNFLHSVEPGPLAAVAPERVTIIR